MNQAPEPLIVRSLLCHAHVAMGIECLSTLYRYSDRTIDLRLHNDGSLTTEDEAKLRVAFPTATIIPRQEADEVISAQLRALPHCLEFRRRFVSALKMFDTLLMGDEPFLLLDADVLFFRPFELPVENYPEKALIYMEDYMYAYTLTPWEAFRYRELKSVYRLNSGMMMVRGERIDLAFVEYLLEKHPQFRRNWQVEQTIWGILAHKYGSARWNKRQVTVVTHDFQPAPDQVAGHFVTLARDRLKEFLTPPPDILSNARVRVQIEEAPIYHPFELTTDHYRNMLHNGLYRLRTSLAPRAVPA